jgi:hypothetical protein
LFKKEFYFAVPNINAAFIKRGNKAIVSRLEKRILKHTFVTGNPDFTIHALCQSRKKISTYFPSIRETGLHNQVF